MLEFFASNAMRFRGNNGALMDIYCMQGAICKNRNLLEVFVKVNCLWHALKCKQ